MIKEYNERYAFFKEITGLAMRVHSKYHCDLLESAYEAALKYLLEQAGHKVERQVFVPMYWDDVRLDQDYRLDLLVDDDIIVELKAINHIDTPQRRQLINYLQLTHKPYGMLINFGAPSLYSEWYERDAQGIVEKVRLL